MRLSDAEKRDAIKYIQEGKPLPEKYRFLLFDDDREVELVWNGKTQEVCNLVLPFQTIEHIDEPRSEKITKDRQLNLFDTSGRQTKGWTNKLIWGDSKLILSSLKNGPMRREIEKQGGLKLIYIDPPFDVGADFSMNIEIGEETFTKKPSIIEEVAYRDTWGKGVDSFIAMIYERLKLMYGLLADDGGIYVHCDWRANSLIRMVLDEIFGGNNYRNEIIVRRIRKNVKEQESVPRMNIGYDSIYFYAKTDIHKIKPPLKEEEKQERWHSFEASGIRRGMDYDLFGFKPRSGNHWRWSYERAQKAIKDGKLRSNPNSGKPEYFIPMSTHVLRDNLWDDIVAYSFSQGYPTEKKEEMLELILKASSDKDDIIADFFCGSGTALAVAEKLGRKWIGADLGRFAIHTSRKRLIQVQRNQKKEGKNFRAFEILNLGKYEREYYVNADTNLRDKERQKIIERKEKEYSKLILSAYKAQPVDSYNNFVGKKRDRLVAIGPIDIPVSFGFVDQTIKEALEKGVTKIDILGFDYEMGIDFSEYKNQGVDAQFKVIPREVFDRRAVGKGEVKFYDVAYVEIKPIIKGRGNKKIVAVELCDFSVFYNQDSTEKIEELLKKGSNKVVIEDGQVIKVSKDKKTGAVKKEVLTTKWMDWVDYWSVDFDMESRKETIRVVDPETKKENEEWTGGYVFENEWQSFRTKKDRKLELISAEKEVSKGKRKVAVKVVDIFGNDTTKVVEVNIT